MLYAVVILIANLIIICGHLIFAVTDGGSSILRAVVTPPFLTVAVIAVDGIFAFIVRRLPEKWFSVESGLSTVSHAESDLYRRLGVRRWRDKIPELGMVTGFHKDHIYEPTNNEYLRRFVLEANYGAIIHFVCVPAGLLMMLLVPYAQAITVGIPVILVNAVLNLMPAFVLRYNVPKLISLMKLNERRAKKSVTAEKPSPRADAGRKINLGRKNKRS